jgi:hypothetical protein
LLLFNQFSQKSVFSQVCKTSIIPEYPFHFIIIFEGVFGFFGKFAFSWILGIIIFFLSTDRREIYNMIISLRKSTLLSHVFNQDGVTLNPFPHRDLTPLV